MANDRLGSGACRRDRPVGGSPDLRGWRDLERVEHGCGSSRDNPGPCAAFPAIPPDVEHDQYAGLTAGQFRYDGVCRGERRSDSNHYTIADRDPNINSHFNPDRHCYPSSHGNTNRHSNPDCYRFRTNRYIDRYSDPDGHCDTDCHWTCADLDCYSDAGRHCYSNPHHDTNGYPDTDQHGGGTNGYPNFHRDTDSRYSYSNAHPANRHPDPRGSQPDSNLIYGFWTDLCCDIEYLCQ